MQEKNIIEQLLDEENIENITLYDQDNNPIEFEQIALLPLESTGKLYAFLLPVTPMQGVKEDEGVLFELDETKGDITVVTEEKIIEEAMIVYQSLLDEEDK